MMGGKPAVSLALCTLVVLGGLGGLAGIGGADSEPNDTMGQAELISPGTHSGVLNVSNNPDDLVDYYKFNVSAAQVIGYELHCGNVETGMVKYTMYRPNGTKCMESTYISPGGYNILSWITNDSGAGQWYMKVEGPNSYSFNLTLTNQTDGGAQGDAGDDLGNPRALAPNATYLGMEGDDDPADFYSIGASEGQLLTIDIRELGGQKRADFTFHDIDKKVIGHHTLDADGSWLKTFYINKTGTHYIGISSDNCTYSLNITLKGGGMLDTSVPSVAITSPVNGTTVANASFNLTGTASDDVGVESVEISLSGIVWVDAIGTDNWKFDWLVVGEGINTIYARATDYSGKQNISWIHMAYVPGGAKDTDKPSVFVTSPENGITLNVSTFDLAGTASDNFGVAKVEVSLSGIVWWTAAGTVNWTFRLMIGDGINSIWVKATDFAGNYNITSLAIGYSPPGANDTERPQVSVTSPANGTTVHSSRFNISGTASDNFGVFKVEVSLSAIVWLLANGTTLWTYADFAIGEGINTVWVKATDFAGNYNITWMTMAYDPSSTNDTKYPKVWVTSPANGSTLNASTFDVVGAASDDYGVFKVELSLSGIVWWMANGTLNWTYPCLAIGEGINQIWVRAIDYSGKVTIIWVELAYEPGGSKDTLKPSVMISSPVAGTVSNSSAINLTGTASDNYRVFRVEVSRNGNDWMLARGVTAWSYSSYSLNAGKNNIYVRATDFSGNYNTTTVSVIYNPGKAGDKASPTITILGPKNKALFSTNKLNIVSGQASDNIAVLDVELTVNGVRVPVVYSAGLWSATNIRLKEGRNTLAAMATDYAGNTQTTSVTVTYEKPKPQPGFEGILLVGAMAALLVIFSSRGRR